MNIIGSLFWGGIEPLINTKKKKKKKKNGMFCAVFQNYQHPFET